MAPRLSNTFLFDRLVAVANELKGMHGTFFAAAFLADVGVPLDTALAALTRPQRCCIPNRQPLATTTRNTSV